MSIDGLMNFYTLKPVTKRQDEHLYSTMYRLSKNPNLIDEERQEIHLRGRNKVKFKKYKRTYEKYLKCPLARDITLWDRLVENVQRSTTKFKFKREIQNLIY